MQWRFRFTSLKTKMVVTVSIIVAVLVSAVVIWNYLHYVDDLKETIAKQQFALVSASARHIDEQITIAQFILGKIAEELGQLDLSAPETLQKKLDEEDNTHIFFESGLLIIGKDGRLLVESPFRENRRGMDFNFREYVAKTLHEGKPYVSEIYRTTFPPYSPTIAFTFPIKDRHGRVTGILVGRHNLMSETFLGKTATTRIGKSGYLYVFNDKRMLIMHADKKRVMETVKPGANIGLDKALQGFEGTMENTNSKGVKGLTSFKRLATVNWIVAAHFPQAEAYALITMVQKQTIVALLAANLVAMLIVWLVMGRLTAPLTSLTRHVATITDKSGPGRLVQLEASDEIGALADAFNSMVAELDKQQLVLQRSQEIYRTVVECSSELAIWRAPDRSVVYVSPNCLELTGYNDSEFYLDPELLENSVHPDDKACWLGHNMEDDKPYAHDGFEVRLLTKEGECRWFNHSCHPIYNDCGEFRGFRGSFRDVTAQVEAESRLRKLSRAVEQSPCSIVITDTAGAIEYINPKFTQVSGYTAEEALGQNPRLLKSGEMAAEGYRELWETITSGREWSGEFHNKRKNGELYWEHASISPISGNDGLISHFIAIKEDITARKAAEEAMLRSEEKFSKAFHGSPDWIVISRFADGCYLDVNAAFLAVTGFTRGEVLGKSSIDLGIWAEPGERQRNVEQLMYSGRINNVEVVFRTKEGDCRNMLWSADLIDYNGEVCIIAVARDITALKLTERELNKSRAELQINHEELKHLYQQMETKNSELEKAYAELQATQTQFLQQEKMASIGQLAAGVAHEINNPIGFVASNLSTLEKYTGRLAEFISLQEAALKRGATELDLVGMAEQRKKMKLDYVMEDIPQLIKESLDGADRVKKIVADLKSFSRLDEAEHKYADINECLESTINIVWNELKYKVTLHKELGDLPQIRCFPQQLNQVFLNLLVNASHAIEKQGDLTVRTWQEEGYVKIAVTDTGCGITEETQQRIFEPFFTTKEVGKGTGLGLSISYDIIKRHQGEIEVASEVGVGTTFTVKLPVEEVSDGRELAA